ncbi:hypothetical protein IL306_012678 [Fusarium sp. DS 682]|nr:hypothetical protein IL306_012678 [Fusarium sp. DS 682]
MPPNRNSQEQGQSRREDRDAPYSAVPSADFNRRMLQRLEENLARAQRELEAFCLQTGQTSSLLTSEPSSEGEEQEEEPAPTDDASSESDRCQFCGGSAQTENDGGNTFFYSGYIPPSPEGLIIRVANPEGEVATRYINTRIGVEEYPQSEWYAFHVEKGYIGAQTDGSIDRLADRLRQDEGCVTVFFLLIPDLPDRFDRISMRQTQISQVRNNGCRPGTDDGERYQRVLSNATEMAWEDDIAKNKAGKPAGIFRKQVDIPPVSSQKTEDKKCGVCGRKTHTVATCLKASPRDGAVVGCPLCNSNEHSGGNCTVIASLPFAEQVQMLIVDRANMPPFRSTIDQWWYLLYKYIVSGGDLSIITGFPWSKGFTNSQGRNLAQLQKLLDNGAEGFKMPVDSTYMCDDASAFWWLHWKPSNLPWPANLGPEPIPVVPDSND